MNNGDDFFNARESARRRDEVIRRMANTPPQPNGEPKSPPQGKKKPTDSGRAKSARARDSA